MAQYGGVWLWYTIAGILHIIMWRMASCSHWPNASFDTRPIQPTLYKAHPVDKVTTNNSFFSFSFFFLFSSSSCIFSTFFSPEVVFEKFTKIPEVGQITGRRAQHSLKKNQTLMSYSRNQPNLLITYCKNLTKFGFLL